MTAAELLLDLSERLTEADEKLRALAHEQRDASLMTTFDGERVSLVADRMEAKAEGIRLALSYVTELQRMAGADVS